MSQIKINNLGLIAFVLMAFASTPLYAGQVTYANDAYTSGDTLTAAGLNAKFNELKAMINDNNTRIADLENALTAANDKITALETNNVMALDPYLSVSTDSRGPLVQLSGINLQLINGVDFSSINGLGNLIIGYDVVRTTGVLNCADGFYADQPTCEGAGEVWAVSHKNGSHNLVIGNQHNYSQLNGLLAGFNNTVNRVNSSVSGGANNTASGGNSSVSGGLANTANVAYSSVSGGLNNTASGDWSSVSGGQNNTASGYWSSVSGGQNNTASGMDSSVSGGRDNIAFSVSSSVSGGVRNTASGDSSSVSGGNGCNTTNISNKWIVGGTTAGCSANEN